MKLHQGLLVLAVIASAAGAVSAQGNVTVSFDKPDQFADAGEYGARRDANLKVIATYLEKLGRTGLQAGQSLKVEVLDVDLAGSTRPSARLGEVRIIRSAADRPSISLHYTLEQDGKTLRSGETRLSDLAFLDHVPSYTASDPLRYEKRMLDEWFKASIAAPAKG